MENIYCPICMEKGAAMTTPIVLFPCTHTICGPCFISFLENEKRLARSSSPCPLCARPVMVGHWAAPVRTHRGESRRELAEIAVSILVFSVGLWSMISWAYRWFA